LACEEVLKLDPKNIKALYRKGRALSLPINSGVEDFRKALLNHKSVIELDSNNIPALKEIRRLNYLIEINRKREKETYGKMFNKLESVSDYVD
jgi:hypothetical protein